MIDLVKLVETQEQLSDNSIPLKNINLDHLTVKHNYNLLTEFDVSIQCATGGNQVYFESTIQVRDYGDDIAVYLGTVDISNEVSGKEVEAMIEDNQ